MKSRRGGALKKRYVFRVAGEINGTISHKLDVPGDGG